PINRPPSQSIANQSPPPARPLHSPAHGPDRPDGQSTQSSTEQNSTQFVAVRPGEWRPASESQEHGSDLQDPQQPAEEIIDFSDLSNIAGDTWPSRLKTILAAVGLFAIFFQCMRLLGSND
ncbi:MAG: hypothetical protein JXM70_10260, partial [Pirellulales bacterium]|nr:hypothetical protein [Pirellulales bacterium]